MHRRPVLDMLARYQQRYPEEADCVDVIRDLVLTHQDCLLRTCQPGHITAAAWIVSNDRRHFLLTHHRKLDRWLQLGGHVDGEPHPEQAALREAREESGMDSFQLVSPPSGEVLPLDIDVHEIPARGPEPAHFHHDLRFLLVAASGQRLRISPESKDLKWFRTEDLESVVAEENLVRMGLKARLWLRSWA
ncbi:MAG: NUDIX hydrolase [Planctomycetota bacterium]|jgi:8-oxo-dGTP pyrophosphatase MutT (NUDIX family)